LNDDRMMQKSIKQCRGNHGIAEDIAPFRKATV
jgi:hypothetical protein